MQRENTGYTDTEGKPIQTGDVVERIGLLKTPKRFVVFRADWSDVAVGTEWRLDSTGNRTALIYESIVARDFRNGITYKVLGRYDEHPELLTV